MIDGTIYAPPGVYTRTLTENPLASAPAGVRVPMLMGTGNESLTQQNLELVRGSSSSVDQFVPSEDATGRAVVEILPSGEVTLGNFNGVLRRLRVRNYPIVSGSGAGQVATESASITVTINGRPDVVLSVARADIGVIEISTAPALGDDVRISYFFKRTDTRTTDDVSSQVTATSAIILGGIGVLPPGYEFSASTQTLSLWVDAQTTVTVNFGSGFRLPSDVVSLINGAAAGTTLLASTFVNNFGLTAVQLSAARELEIKSGTANTVLGLTPGTKTTRKTAFVVFNGPVVDGTNGGVTTTDPTKVVVKVNNVTVDPLSVDGASRTITLPLAPEVGSTVTIQYWYNTWQDTFDELANIGVTSITRCGIVPGNSDYIQGADFILKNNQIVWGAASLVNPGQTAPNSVFFGTDQVTTTLIDNRWYLAPVTSVVDTNVNPPLESRTKFQLPAQPTTGNGRDNPLGQTTFLQVANGRVDLPTNNPSLVLAYWGFGVQDAIDRGSVAVLSITDGVFTLKEPVPVGAEVFATFYYNLLEDDRYTLLVENPGPSGVGTYSVFDSDENPLYTPKFGTKGAAMVGVTVQFPSGSELTPDVHFEGGTSGPVEETVSVQFDSRDATLAKFSVSGKSPYNFVSGASDRARFTIDSAALAGGATGISLTAPHGITGLGFAASLLGEEILYTVDSGQTTYDVETGINDQVAMTLDGITITTTVPAAAGVDADAYVEAINATAKLAANAPIYTSQTRFIGAVTISAGRYNTLVFNYTGVTTGSSGPVTVTVPASVYNSPLLLASALDTAVSAAVGALPASFDGLDVTVSANANGQLTFKLLSADQDLGTFASGTITTVGALLGDTVTIGGITLTGDLAQVAGDLNWDTGQARGTILPVGVRPGDTITIDTGGGPIVLTASGAQTPGGLNFDEGVQSTGTISANGILPGDTVTIGGITLTASGSQTPGGLDFNEGTRATGTATLTAAQYGDTVTIGGVVLTADNTQTPGGLNFNVGEAATATIQCVGIRPADTITIDGTVLTAGTAQVGGAYNFNAGARASGTITTAAVLTGDTVTVSGVTLTAAGAQTAGGLNFNEGTKASGTYTVNATPSLAILTTDGSPLIPAGGPRTPGSDDYDDTLGSAIAIAADIAAAINDPLNSWTGIVTASVIGPVVTITAVVPGAVGNAITIVSDDGTVTASGAVLAGGVGTDTTVATSIAAAINDALNGLSTTLTAAGVGPVVTVTALTPGAAGNANTLVSSDAIRLALSGAIFAGGVGTDTTAATSLAAAINDALNVPLPSDFTAVALGDTVTITANVPGLVGNSMTLATSAAGRAVLSGATFTGGVGDDISAGSSLVAAILDVGNGLTSLVLGSNVGGTTNVVTITAYVPGAGGNAIALASSNPLTIAISGGTLAGGVGTNTTVALSIAAAIADVGNGLTTLVTGLAAINVVNLTAITPGNVGNTILLSSSNAIRISLSGPSLSGGIGTNFTVASSIVAALNDVGNGLAAFVSAANDGGLSSTVTVWADTPGVGGNLFTLASSTGTRLAVSAATFVGGATNIQVATSLVNAILAVGNGLDALVEADNSAATSNVVTVTALVPGPLGNQITLASSSIVRLAVSAATLLGGVGLGGGYLEFLTGPTYAQDFSVLAGISTDTLPGRTQTKLVNGDVVRRFTAVGTSGRLIYDRLVVRSRIFPGSGSMHADSQIGLTGITIEGSNAISQTGLVPKAVGLAANGAVLHAASLFGEVGFGGSQVPAGTYGDARDGQPLVQFFAAGGVNVQNNVFKANIDGKPFTVVFKTAAGATIAAAGQADVPLGPITIANTVLWQIQQTMVAAGLSSTQIQQEGAGIRLLSARVDAGSAITISAGNANEVLGFFEGTTVGRTLVEVEAVASALMAHHSAVLSTQILDYASPQATYFAAQALAGVVYDAVGSKYLYIQSQANNFVGLGPSSNITFLTAGSAPWLLTGTGLGVLSSEGAVGESAMYGYYVTSSDPIDGSGSANTSIFNNGVGQDGLVGQTYRDAVTGLTFTVLPREGGAAYPTGAGANFTFEVRRLVTTDANLPINTIPGIELLVANTSSTTAEDTAIVETFDRGGQEPAVGDTYYVSYVYTKDTSAFVEAGLFTSMQVVERNYGPITPDFPLSLGAYLAFQNGAVVVGLKQLRKESSSNQASLISYEAGLNSLRGNLNGVILDIIVPLQNDIALFQLIKRHCELQSSIRYKAERTAILGVRAGTQPSEVGSLAQALHSERVAILYPDILSIALTDALGNQRVFLVDGPYAAAAFAGARCATDVDVATPWVRQRIVGFRKLERFLDAVEQNQVAVQGVTVMEQVGSVIRIRDGLSTNMDNILTKIPTVTTIKDEVQRGARRDLDRFIGIKFLPGILSQIEGQLSSTLKSYKNAEIISAFQGVSANTTADPTYLEVMAAYSPVFPLLQILVTFNLRTKLNTP